MASDLILLHAPSVYDFRKRPVLFGPVSDVVPSTQVFEMYPIGFLTILEHLEQHGYRVRIINVALKMTKSRRFDPVKMIRKLKPMVFGIDLHWMVHAQGSLELARIVKKEHPDIPVVFGGLSSSFFHKELMSYPQVDFVLRGDSTEKPFRALMDCIKEGRDLSEVPNLTWRKNGGIKINPLEEVPDSLDHLSFDYRSVMSATMKSVLSHLDFFGHMPFSSWLSYPILAALSCRGCVHNCVICGGSSHAYRNICKRDKPAFRASELLAEDIALMSPYIKAPVIVLGDILQGGNKRMNSFLAALKKHNIKNHVAVEFFSPPEKGLLRRVHEAVPNYNIQISPESHDEKVREAFGRNYTNKLFERFLAEALDEGCSRIDVFFMIGLPLQTADSVMETIDYCRRLLGMFGTGAYKGRLRPFISPLAPFLDPGSPAFDDPDSYGYRLIHKTFEEHVNALLEPSWKYTLNYETKWMTREEIASVTYEAALALNSLKQEYGILSKKDAEKVELRIAQEREIMHRIDDVYDIDDREERDAGIVQIMEQFPRSSGATICRKDEMNWPSKVLKFRPVPIMKYLLGKLKKPDSR